MPFLIIVFFLVCNHSVYAEKDPAFRFEGNATPNFFDIQKEFYKQKKVQVQQERKELFGNPELLEKIAREKYLMKKPTEDLYVVVEK